MEASLFNVFSVSDRIVRILGKIIANHKLFWSKCLARTLFRHKTLQDVVKIDIVVDQPLGGKVKRFFNEWLLEVAIGSTLPTNKPQ